MPLLVDPCRTCGLPLPPGYTGKLCGTCLAYAPPWSLFSAPFCYSPPVSALVPAFKYQGRLVAGRVLAQCLIRHLQKDYRNRQWPSLIIPAPLHQNRIRERGFNQALVISRWLSKALSVPLDRRSVIRRKSTDKQTGLSARSRKLNLRGAFQVVPDAEFSPGVSVALVDDVVTTGVTITELASVLRKAGIEDIHVWALARTVL
jgi:ComF family protein